MAPVKVLIVSPIPPPRGGIGRWTVILLDWLRFREDVKFFLVDISPRWPVVDHRRGAKRLLGGCFQGVRDLGRVLIQLLYAGPDVLHLTTSGSMACTRDIAVLSLAHLFRVPSVYHLHFGRVPQLAKSQGWEWRLLSAALRLARKVIVIDKATESELNPRLPAQKLLRIPNAISVDAMNPFNPSGTTQPKVVLFLGWVIPTKGIRELIEAWQTLNRRGWKLVVAGPGSRQYQQQMLHCVEGNLNVMLLGECSQLQAWQLMQQAQIFALPSYTEAFPYVILEAMAAGTAIVATQVGAIAEMLDAETDRPCGLLVQPRDTAGLARALSHLMDDDVSRMELSLRARAKVEQCYGLEKVLGRYVNVWQGLTMRFKDQIPY